MIVGLTLSFLGEVSLGVPSVLSTACERLSQMSRRHPSCTIWTVGAEVEMLAVKICPSEDSLKRASVLHQYLHISWFVISYIPSFSSSRLSSSTRFSISGTLLSVPIQAEVQILGHVLPLLDGRKPTAAYRDTSRES